MSNSLNASIHASTLATVVCELASEGAIVSIGAREGRVSSFTVATAGGNRVEFVVNRIRISGDDRLMVLKSTPGEGARVLKFVRKVCGERDSHAVQRAAAFRASRPAR